MGRAGALCAKHGTAQGLTFRYFASDAPDASELVASAATPPMDEDLDDEPSPMPFFAPEAPKNSTWTETVVDSGAKARIEATHDKLRAAGVAVDTKEQLFATGTRMADVGYATQTERKAEHDVGTSVADAVHALATTVRDEKREDRIVSAAEFARNVSVNGKVRAFGLALTENALRGLFARIESPGIGYAMGLRRRIAETLALSLDEHGKIVPCPDCASDVQGRHFATCPVSARARADKNKIAEILVYECERAGDAPVKLRTRTADANGDIFAIVGPSYAAADAPEALAELAEKLPADARATWNYDPGSTAWELRASVWTPTPVSEQAVGEPFRGYASFRSSDNGTGRFRGGGGIELLRCLNASVYEAEGAEVTRIHRGNVLRDVGAMIAKSTAAIDVLCEAWGRNRETVVEPPKEAKKITIADQIPGFWRWLLTDNRSELAAVLPGRKENRIEQLTAAYHDERRDPARLVRADFAQAWTRAIQDEPSDVRRAAEVAAGDFIVSDRKIGYLESE